MQRLHIYALCDGRPDFRAAPARGAIRNHIVALRRMLGACQMVDDEKRRALSILEAARTCGLSRSTVYRLIAQKKLATIKVGTRRLVPIAAVDDLLKAAE
jgi:excisionase family DNA binding protein